MEKKILILVFLATLQLSVLAQEKISGLLERSEIEEKYKWDTKDVYKSDQDWEEDFTWIKQNLSYYENFRGKLGSTAGLQLECLEFDGKIKKKLGYLWLYARLNKDVDNSNPKYQDMWSKYSAMESKVEIARSFIRPEIILIPEKTIQQFITEETKLGIYAHFLERLALKKEHTLTEDKEEILARTSILLNIPYSLYETLVYAELPFPVIKDDKGKDIGLNRSTSWRARSSQDRDYRKRGYREYYRSLMNFEGTLTLNLSNFIEGKVVIADLRNYNSALEASLARYNIPVIVYQNLVESARSNLQPLHRWMKMKKKLLGYDTLHIYDTRVSMFPGIQKEYTWEDAHELTLKSLGVLGEDYLTDIKNAYTNRWIDVYPNKGKETGGYSSGCAGPHPYVKMNWGGKLLDFYTLVHELGHYVHATKTMKTQPFIYADFPSFLSEVASTTAENISQLYLIQNSESEDEKLYFLEQYIDNLVLLIYNSAMMAEFEKLIYQTVENGNPLSAGELSELYGRLLKEYYGEDVVVDEIDKHSWLEWPHYYLDYYLYSYATSFSASVQIASDILNEGEPAVQRFINFLHAGSSDYPVEVLKNAGVDMTTTEPYEAVAGKFDELLDEMEKILNE